MAFTGGFLCGNENISPLQFRCCCFVDSSSPMFQQTVNEVNAFQEAVVGDQLSFLPLERRLAYSVVDMKKYTDGRTRQRYANDFIRAHQGDELAKIIAAYVSQKYLNIEGRMLTFVLKSWNSETIHGEMTPTRKYRKYFLSGAISVEDDKLTWDESNCSIIGRDDSGNLVCDSGSVDVLYIKIKGNIGYIRMNGNLMCIYALLSDLVVTSTSLQRILKNCRNSLHHIRKDNFKKNRQTSYFYQLLNLLVYFVCGDGTLHDDLDRCFGLQTARYVKRAYLAVPLWMWWGNKIGSVKRGYDKLMINASSDDVCHFLCWTDPNILADVVSIRNCLRSNMGRLM